MTALAQIDDEQLVSQPDQGTIFLSRRRGLRLTKVPRYPIMGPSGQKVGEKPGETIPFREGRLFVPADGKFTLEDGREIDAGEVRDWLLKHRLLGDVSEGFWAVETTAPPISPEETQAITSAAMDWNIELLERIAAQERAGWGREQIIAIAEGAIERIRIKEAEMRAEIEAEKAAAAPKPRSRTQKD